MITPLLLKQRIKEAFSKQIRNYEQEASLQKQVVSLLKTEFPKTLHGSVLEIGVGTGLLTAQILQTYRDITLHGLDISSAMLEKCLKKYRFLPQCVDFEIFSTSKKFNAIFSSMTFQWFFQPELMLQKMKSLLVPGGALVLAYPNQNSYPEWQAFPLNPMPFHVSGFREQQITQTFPSAWDFLRHLKRLGAHTPLCKTKRNLKEIITFGQRPFSITTFISYGVLYV